MEDFNAFFLIKIKYYNIINNMPLTVRGAYRVGGKSATPSKGIIVLNKGKKRVPKPVKSYVRRQINKSSETKVYHAIAEEQTVDTTTQSYIQDLSSILQGVQSNQRVGVKVKATGLHTRLTLNNNSNKTNFVRVLVVGTYDPNDVSTSSELFLTVAGAPTSIASSPGLKCLNLSINKARYTPLYDKMVKLGPSGSTDGTETRFIKFWRKLNKTISFDAATYGAGNQSYRYHMLLIPSEASDDTLPSSIEATYACRLFYKDT